MSYKIEITYKNTTSLKISIKNNEIVHVIAPKGLSKDKILEVVKSKSKWIEKHQSKIIHNSKYKYHTKNLIDNEVLFFLGNPYKVKLVESNSNIIFDNDEYLEFHLTSSVIDNNDFKLGLLAEFYLDRADIIFNNLVAKYLKITNQEILRVNIKKTKTRWGSCNYVKKIINLNIDLIQRDIRAIEYVVLHEIAHLTYPNHSKDFYNYIAQYMPDWKAREKILK